MENARSFKILVSKLLAQAKPETFNLLPNNYIITPRHRCACHSPLLRKVESCEVEGFAVSLASTSRY
jgi:hypothetical protein